jgi:hypothetical protein
MIHINNTIHNYLAKAYQRSQAKERQNKKKQNCSRPKTEQLSKTAPQGSLLGQI